MAIELAKDLFIEQLLSVKGIFGPESADLLLRNSCATGKISHHAPILLPVGIRLALCLTREQFESRIDFVFEEIIEAATFWLGLSLGEGRCLQHPLIQTLVKDVELARILSESHLHGIILARRVLSQIPLSIHVALLPLSDVFGLLLAGHLDGDLEDPSEVIQIDVVFAR